MLGRAAATVWVAWIVLIGASFGIRVLAPGIPNPWPLVGLWLLMLGAGAWVGGAGLFRLARGPRRGATLATVLVGLAPLEFFVGHAMLAARPGFDRRAPLGWPSRLLAPLGLSVMELQSRWRFPIRTAGRRVVMAAPVLADPRRAVEAMDRHADALLARLHLEATWPITWNRGPMFGLTPHAIDNMAISVEPGGAPAVADGLAAADFHEVAHCVIGHSSTAATDPPTILSEGWAEANSRIPAADQARRALELRREGRTRSLRRLVGPDWYRYAGSLAYVQGAPLVDHLLRAYGPERFLRLLTTCRQATFEADCRRILGAGLDEIDAACWADIERVAGRDDPPGRRWLAELAPAEGVAADAWRAFLADYFAAADRITARYADVRLVATTDDPAVPADRPSPIRQRHELARSGGLARLWCDDGRSLAAFLARPDRSIRALRELNGDDTRWQIRDDPEQTPDQAYRTALDRIDQRADPLFLRLAGGAVLLHIGDELRSRGEPRDFEVAGLRAETRDGERVVAVHLRSRPAPAEPPTRANAPASFRFVLAIDDCYAARTTSSEFAGGRVESRFEYDHPGGPPVLRGVSFAFRDADGSVATRRYRVERVEFGPVPAAEFAFEPFRARLEPSVASRDSFEAPPRATFLRFAWVPIALGGLGLGGGAIIASVDRRGRAGAGGGSAAPIG